SFICSTTATTEIYTLSLHDALPICANAIAEEASKTASIATAQAQKIDRLVTDLTRRVDETSLVIQEAVIRPAREGLALVAAVKADRKSTRLNSSHVAISYAVFCLKK